MLSGWQLKVLLAMGIAVPALTLRLTGTQVDALPAMFIFGAAIVGAAFALAWAAEAAQKDISAGLAIAVLAFIAVLPEYAVDLYFAYASGSNPDYEQYAVANMTGGNRLLLGLGWPVVAFVFFLGARRRGEKVGELFLDRRRRVELGFLAVAGAYAFIVPATRRLSLIDTVVLLALFAFYLATVARQKRSEPHLVGVAERLGSLAPGRRRSLVAALFAVAATAILAAAEPFAHSLVETGTHFGIDEFLLVQWLAPLASESPEFIVAALLAFRGKGDAGLGTLLSSKVNQWTLLVGSIPLAHLVGGGGLSLALDARQGQEFLLTAAQTVLGLAVLMNLRFSGREAMLLLALFLAQFALPGMGMRLVFTILYLALAALVLLGRRQELKTLGLGLFALLRRSERPVENTD